MTAIQSEFGKVLLRVGALALVGSGIAACKEQSESAARGAAAQTSGLAAGSTGFQRMLGHGFVHGHDPNEAADWDGNSDSRDDLPNFDPKYYAVVYIQFGNGGRLTARHAYFQVQGDDKVSCAIEYLKSYRPENPLPLGCEPYVNAATRPDPVSFDFDRFFFGSQSRLYVFVDNENIKFNPVNPISFTPFSAFDRPAKEAQMDGNNSFYNASLKSHGSYEGVLSVDNYYMGQGDNLIRNRWPFRYSTAHSINFNLLSCRTNVTHCTFSDDQVIPLVIDPDTGNGWGYGP